MNTFNELLAYIAVNIADAGASYRIVPAIVRNSFNWFVDLVRKHTEDLGIHTTQEDKDAINAHIADNSIHLDPADKINWDNKATIKGLENEAVKADYTVDFNNIKTSWVSLSRNNPNCPPTTRYGIFSVYGDGSIAIQTFSTFGSSVLVYGRSLTAGAWQPWKLIAQDQEPINTHIADNSIHLDPADKINWDNTATNFIAHENNPQIHTSQAEKDAINAHISDPVKHVTQADKDKWNSLSVGSMAFLSEDTSNGTAINSVSSYTPCYVGNGQIVYRNATDSDKLYLKNINDTSNGTAITSVNSHTPCYVGNGQIVYRNATDSGKLYLKNINDTSNGTAITSVSSYTPCYVGNGQIVYVNGSDGSKLYLKNINDTSNGIAINSVSSSFSCYVGNGQIVYGNIADSDKLYLKDINDTSNGTAITSVSSYTPCYVGNGQIVYFNGSDGSKLYLKNINDTSNGIAINSVSSSAPCYVGGGQIVYRNATDSGKLYLKNIKIEI